MKRIKLFETFLNETGQINFKDIKVDDTIDYIEPGTSNKLIKNAIVTGKGSTKTEDYVFVKIGPDIGNIFMSHVANHYPKGLKEAVDINLFTWNEKTKTFAAEVSDLQRKVYGGEKVITIHNPTTNKSVEFTFVKADKDGSDEDTYGWHYVNKEQGLNLLIIND